MSCNVWCIPGFLYFQYDCIITAKTVLKLPPPLRSSINRRLSRLVECWSPSKSMIYSTVLYHRYIPGIHLSYSFSSTLAGLPGLPSAQGCFGPGFSADYFCFSDWKPANSRLRPAKVPQPGVDFINMASPAWSWARLTVSTSKFEGLFLACSVLVRNGSCGVPVKKAGKEWNPPKEVPYPANIQSTCCLDPKCWKLCRNVGSNVVISLVSNVVRIGGDSRNTVLWP